MVQKSLPLDEPLSVELIDRLTARCDAYLDELAAVEKELRPGIPIEAHRITLMGGHRNSISAVRALLKDVET